MESIEKNLTNWNSSKYETKTPFPPVVVTAVCSKAVISVAAAVSSLFVVVYIICVGCAFGHKSMIYNITCVKRPHSKRQKIGFQYQLSLNAGQKYCRMFQWEHSAILSTFIKLPFVIKIFVLSIFEWPFYTGFTVKS